MVFGKKSGGVFKLETVAKMNKGKVKRRQQETEGGRFYAWSGADG